MMTQEDRLDKLIDWFREDSEEASSWEVPAGTEEKRRLLRSLMNVRMPRAVPDEILRLQDAYLSERAAERGIVALSGIPSVREALHSAYPYADRVFLWQGDITCLQTDAIVNAANSAMLGCFAPLHNCIDNCIHTYAGVQLRNACDKQMRAIREKLGETYMQPTAIPMVTDAYNLPAKKVIHVVGPIVNGPLTARHEEQLAACYRNTLALCEKHACRSVAFCCISTGVFLFPNERAAEIAVETVTKYYKETDSPVRVVFNVFLDKDRLIYERLLA